MSLRPQSADANAVGAAATTRSRGEDAEITSPLATSVVVVMPAAARPSLPTQDGHAQHAAIRPSALREPTFEELMAAVPAGIDAGPPTVPLPPPRMPQPWGVTTDAATPPLTPLSPFAPLTATLDDVASRGFHDIGPGEAALTRSFTSVLQQHEAAIKDVDAVRLQLHVDRVRHAADARAAVDSSLLRPFFMNGEWSRPVLEWLPAPASGSGSQGAAADGGQNQPRTWQMSIPDGFEFHIGRVHGRFHLPSMVVRVVLLGIGWLTLWAIFPAHYMYPGGIFFDPLACWLMATVFGTVFARIVGVPSLLGILIFGIIWGNIPKFGHLTAGIVTDVRTVLSRIALGVVLCRAGLSLNTGLMVASAKMVVPFALLPLAAEIVVHGGVAYALFDDYTNIAWPFLQGALSAPTSAAILVPGLLTLRASGYGLKRGPINAIMISAALDIAFGCWCVNFLVDLLFLKPEDSIGWLVGAIPLQFAIGISGGILAAALWDLLFVVLLLREAKQLPNGEYWSRHVSSVTRMSWFALTLLSVFSMFLGYRVKYPGGGIAGSFVIGVTANVLMSRRARLAASGVRGYANPLARFLELYAPAPVAVSDMQARMARMMTEFWEVIIVPWVFSMLGSVISLPAVFDGPFFWRALICIFAGVAARVFFAFIATASMEMAWSERLMAALASTSRATAQIGFGQLAAVAIANGRVVTYGGDNDPALQPLLAKRVANVAALSVLIFAPIAAAMLANLAPKLFVKDADWEETKRKEAETDAASAIDSAERRAPTSLDVPSPAACLEDTKKIDPVPANRDAELV